MYNCGLYFLCAVWHIFTVVVDMRTSGAYRGEGGGIEIIFMINFDRVWYC